MVQLDPLKWRSRFTLVYSSRTPRELFYLQPEFLTPLTRIDCKHPQEDIRFSQVGEAYRLFLGGDLVSKPKSVRAGRSLQVWPPSPPYRLAWKPASNLPDRTVVSFLEYTGPLSWEDITELTMIENFDMAVPIWKPSANRNCVRLPNVRGLLSPQKLARQNLSRRGLTLFNNSSGTLLIDFGGFVSISSFLCAIQPGGYWESPFDCTDALWGLWTKQDGYACIREFV